ncbi:MAG: transglutaminase domain-containing protein [Thermoproteota archaeon]
MEERNMFLTKIRKLVKEGKINEARKQIKEKLQREEDIEYREKLLLELFRIDVLLTEYKLTYEEAFNEFKKEVPDITKEEFEKLIFENKLDCIYLEGKIFFFKDFLFNFFKLNSDWESKRTKKKEDESRQILFKHQDEIKNKEGYIPSLKVRVRHSITINPETLKEGEKVRVWIPLPRICELHPTVKIISFYPVKPYISHESSPQRTAYFELYVNKNKTEVSVEYEYVSRAFHLYVDSSKITDYDKNSDIFVKYTNEESPHIEFTSKLRKLAEEIVGGERNPYIKAKKVFTWIIKNIRYNLPYEYVLYDNIPEYVVEKRKGDCGMQALLFITLCRISEVPARWQSGWYMNPKRQSPHDWAQFYVEPYGWLYADPSFAGGMPDERKEFYFGNIDAFRMAANNEISAQFMPPKRHFRSDPVDNQRGEVELIDKNLFYNYWNYKTEVLSYEFLY